MVYARAVGSLLRVPEPSMVGRLTFGMLRHQSGSIFSLTDRMGNVGEVAHRQNVVECCYGFRRRQLARARISRLWIEAHLWWLGRKHIGLGNCVHWSPLTQSP